MWWYALIGVVILILLVGWIANSARLARKNRNLARRSPHLTGRGNEEVDERNRPEGQPPPGESREPQPRPAAPPSPDG